MDIVNLFNKKFNKKQSTYMMVVVLAMIDLSKKTNKVDLEDLALYFKGFYELRANNDKSPEKKERELFNVANMSIGQIKTLLRRMPIHHMEDLLDYDESDDRVSFKKELWDEINEKNAKQIRRKAFGHLYDYYKNLNTSQLTLKDLGNLPMDYAIRANDVQALSNQNLMKGIHPIEKDDYKAIIVLCTISGESYANQWLDNEKQILKYYAEGKKGSDGKKTYNLDFKSNRSIIESKEKGVPLYVFVRYKKGEYFHFEGEFEFVRTVREPSGDVYFELQFKAEGGKEMTIPDVTPEKILEAMRRFDEEIRDSPEMQGWEKKAYQKYAIDYEDKLYPPKRIISLATGLSRDSFSGGEQSNKYLRDRGFKIIELENNNEEPTEIEIINETDITTKQIVNHIINYISNKGFVYSPDFIKNLFLCLKTKPFVILAGISGTGKSKIGELFAEALGANVENGRFKLIPVRPDWSDSTDLIGYKNLQGEFIEGQLTTVIKDAIENPDYPYFVCLDEMNLARVEYYFSDFLSVIESRKYNDGKIVSSPVVVHGFEENITFPENLFVLGTVNMDETTHSFSRKVLDRANTIEFSEVNLKNFPSGMNNNNEPLDLNNALLRSDYITLKDCITGNEADIRDMVDILEQINSKLSTNGFNIGYRVRDEFCFYLLYNKKYDLLSEDVAVDFQIMQKILPRIQGSSIDVEEVLKNLATHCDAKYPMSKAKIDFMLRRFETDGFTSFWA